MPSSREEVATSALSLRLRVEAVLFQEAAVVGRDVLGADDLFSYEPYGFMVRRNDADFRLVADRALAQIYRDGIERLYMLWFGTAGIRPSPVLQAVYTLGALPE